jgi:hypothetical protein
MKTLLQIIEQKSNYTLNLGLKFWWWALETATHRGSLIETKKVTFHATNLMNTLTDCQKFRIPTVTI